MFQIDKVQRTLALASRLFRMRNSVVGLIAALNALVAVIPAAAQQTDIGWPRTVQSDHERIQIYQPQVDQWTEGKLAGRAAPAYIKNVTEALGRWNITIALDRLLADLAITQTKEKSRGEALSMEPPRIYVSENPSVLILIDGDPRMKQVMDTDLMQIINSPAVIVLDTTTGQYYLQGDGYWMTSTTLQGPWSWPSTCRHRWASF